jgi:pyruvate formate lyase activating enzyme
MIPPEEVADVREPPGKAMGKVAELWKPVTGTNKIVCTACARYCKIGEGQVGLCGIRGVHDGKLWLYVYGRVITGHVDPIEKKPVQHYRPGSKIFSIATTGCNWLCRYCFVAETPIETNMGIISIGSIFNSASPTDRPEIRLASRVKVRTHANRWRIVRKAYRHWYSGSIVHVVAQHGTAFRVTPNHGIFVPTRDGTVARREAGSLTEGDQLIIPRLIESRPIVRHPTWVLAGGGEEERDAAANAERTEIAAASVPVERVERDQYVGNVYNIEVEGDHSYTANGFAVANCQNFDISQRRKVEGIEVEPPDVVRMTLEQGCQGLAYTYNQPTIFIEFARDIGMLARKAGLINIFVSNGYDTPETVAEMAKFLDCVTVDFKGSGETDFVRKYINIPNADPIFQTILDMRDTKKIHIEITDLIVPQVGDSLDAARHLSKWVYDHLGPDTPIHFLRFHPDYKMMEFPWTPVETLEKHCAVAKEAGLKYVYVGNVPGHPLEHTYCPGCGAVAVKRFGFDITGWYLDKENKCKKCGTKIAIVGSLEKTARENRFYGVLHHR